MEDISIDLFPLPDEVVGEFRNKNPPGTTYRRDLVDRGNVLTVNVSLALLYHGTLSPMGTEASLLVFDFRFNSTKTTRRFVDATITIRFRDSEEEVAYDPVVRRIAPEDVFSIDPGAESWDVEHRFDVGLNAGIEQAGANINYGTQSAGKVTTEHAVTLVGNKRRLGKDYGGKNAVVWSMEEDPKKKTGIPSLLRAAVLLERKPGRSFTFNIEIQESVDFVSGITSKTKTFFGAEHRIPVDEVEINPGSSSHILQAEDPVVIAFEKTVDWTSLDELNLQDDLVEVTMKKVLMSGQIRRAGKGKE
ncbi:hypothetical protein BFW01_g5892 [Lasiodiplodia theobromae]|nr:hypothetical protein BFW01_g5892 [Lasiodiplodia theobromae]